MDARARLARVSLPSLQGKPAIGQLPSFVGVSYRDVQRAGQQGYMAAIGPRLTGGHRTRTAEV